MSDIFNIGADPLSYSGIGAAKPPILALRAPLATDINYDIGQLWVDTAAGASYVIVSVIAGVATWTLNGAGVGGGIASITGDAGGAEVPDGGGNFNLLGTANEITTTGTLNTQTLTLSATLVAPGSITSTTGIAAGTTLSSVGATTLATAGASVNTFGNTTGATSLAHRVGAAAFSIDGVTSSTYAVGASTTTGTIVIGGTAQTGTITLGSSSGTNIVAIGAGTGATTVNIAGGATNGKAVNIATGAVANTVIIGSTSSTSASTLQSGSGGTSVTAANGAITVASGTGAMNISADAAATTLSIGTGAAAKAVTLGSTNTTSATTVQGGSGGVTITGTNGIITANSGTGAVSVSTDAAATTVNLATGAGAKTVALGSTNTTSATTINAGSGGIHTVSAGLVNIDTAVDTQASPSATSILNVNAGAATFTGFTTASAGTQSFTITNSLVTTSSNILCTVCNEGANDAQMQVTRITRAAGSFVVATKNQGAAALNGNVVVTFWVLDN